jgi:His-Xaa-Ser system radical SAM maturase HxsC
MIPLSLAATSDASAPFVTRLAPRRGIPEHDSICLDDRDAASVWSSAHGIFEVALPARSVMGDILLVDPGAQRADRLLRAGSRHNTFLVTEQCDQLCVMCSQPPRKSHVDRFDAFEAACHLAEPNTVIGISGGEPTLHKDRLFAFLERVLAARHDLSFHILSNGQHFTNGDVERMRAPVFRRVAWGIPLYAADPEAHDRIVCKPGAFERLHDSFVHLLSAGARLELRTVLLSQNLPCLPALAHHVTRLLAYAEQWSLMGLEHAGFARRRWQSLTTDLETDFSHIGEALDIATLYGVRARLFNIPLCHVPAAFRHHAVASISDWKQHFADACASCAARADCSGFFAWHPSPLPKVYPL